MSEKTKTTEEKISDLRAEYVQNLSMRFGEMNKIFMTVIESSCELDNIQHLETLSHTLCGSAGTFGFGYIAGYCKKIERLCNLLVKDTHNVNLINEISNTLSQLEEAVLNPKVTE